MTEIRAERLSAPVDQEFVVFLIGMPVNPFWFDRVKNKMPRFGLAKVAHAVPATGRLEFVPGRMEATTELGV